METTVTAVFDGRVFVPAGPVALPAGTRVRLSLGAAEPALTPAECDRILAGDGSPLPWATVDEAMAYIRRRPAEDPEAP